MGLINAKRRFRFSTICGNLVITNPTNKYPKKLTNLSQIDLATPTALPKRGILVIFLEGEPSIFFYNKILFSCSS